MLQRKIKENIVPFIAFAAILAGCCVAWLLFHPSSPMHKRYTFVVRYEMVGTLSPGNRVGVRGITKGKILKVDLTEDAVYVTAEVLADTKIPKNSEYRLINSGLMGEREMSVLTGDAREYIADGDTVFGYYDEGTGGLSKNLKEIFADIDSIMMELSFIKDSIQNGSTGKRLDRVIKKGGNLLSTSKNVVEDWLIEVRDLLSKYDNIVEQTKSSLEKIPEQADLAVANAKEVLSNADKLLSRVKELKNELDAISSNLEQEDNTAGLILSEKGRILKELDAITADIDALLADIKKNGLKLNVDIF